MVEDQVSTGNYNVLGTLCLRRGTILASRVSITSGRHLHERREEGGWTPMLPEKMEQPDIGPEAWIGEGAVVMADVGRGAWWGQAAW